MVFGQKPTKKSKRHSPSHRSQRVALGRGFCFFLWGFSQIAAGRKTLHCAPVVAQVALLANSHFPPFRTFPLCCSLLWSLLRLWPSHSTFPFARSLAASWFFRPAGRKNRPNAWGGFKWGSAPNPAENQGFQTFLFNQPASAAEKKSKRLVQAVHHRAKRLFEKAQTLLDCQFARHSDLAKCCKKVS